MDNVLVILQYITLVILMVPSLHCEGGKTQWKSYPIFIVYKTKGPSKKTFIFFVCGTGAQISYSKANLFFLGRKLTVRKPNFYGLKQIFVFFKKGFLEFPTGGGKRHFLPKKRP